MHRHDGLQRQLSNIRGKIGGLGSEPNREIVSFRSCVRTRGLVVRSELEKIEARPLSLFPFGSGGCGGSSES